MKTKTFFSRMAWDASQLLRKSFTSLKALTLLFAVGLSVNAWGALSSPSKTTFMSATPYSETLPDDNTDVTWTASAAPSGFDNPRGLQFAGSNFNSKLTFSSSDYSSKTITKIEVVWSRNNSAGATVSATVGGNTFGESDTNSAKTTNRTSTFEGNAKGDIVLSVSSTATGNSFYLQSITVTYTSGITYTITPQSNNDSWGTVELNGSTITATPKSGYRISATNPYEVTSGTAEVEQNGNIFTVTPSTNCTVQINFEEKGCTDHSGTNVTSGTSKDYTYGPVDSYYKYSTRQILYTKTDLGLAAGKKGTIKSIYFEYGYTTAMTEKNSVKIYMANTNLTALSKSAYVPYSDFTEVYSGALNCSNGWNEITLTTPFVYNGSGSVVVLIDDNSNAYDGSDYKFKYHTANGAQIYTRDDNTNENPSSTTWSSYTETNNRPNTKFCIEEADMTKSTVTWYVNNVSKHTQTDYPGTICTAPTTPTTSDCDGSKVFVGWTTSQNYESANAAPSDLFTDPTTKTIPDGGANYYAVFADKTGDETEYVRITQLDELSDGMSLVVVGDKNSHLLKNNISSASAPTESNSKIMVTPSTDAWTLRASGAKWQLCNSSGALGASSTSNGTSVSINNNNNTWTVGKSSSGTNNFYFNVSGTICLEDNNGSWVVYSNNSYTSSNYFTLRLYKANVSFSNYATKCCTPWTTPTLTYTASASIGVQLNPSWGDGTTHGTLTYSSSDEDILEVNASSGVVTTKAAGTAHVIASWSADGDYCDNSTTSNDITVTAAYNITYKDKGGVDFSGNHESGYPKTHTYGTATTLKSASKDYYHFDGWFADENCTGTAIQTVAADAYTADFTLYAKWTPIEYNINYTLNGGTNASGNPATYTYETETITLQDPSKTGHSFQGWFKESTFENQVTTIAKGSHGDIDLFAKWEEILPESFDVDVDNLTLVYDDENNNEGYIQVTFTPSTACDRSVKFEAVKNEGSVVTAYNYGGNDPKLKITAKKEGEAIYKITSKGNESLTKTVTITVKRLPVLTWKDATGEIVATTKATALTNGKVVLPKEADYIKTPETCDEDYDHFMGWSATQFNATTDDPTLVKDGDDVNSDSETGDKTYYAVFAKGTGSPVVYTKVASSYSDWDNNEFLIVYENSSTEGFVMKAEDAINDYVTAEISNGIISTLPEGAMVVKMEANNNKTQFGIKVISESNKGTYLKGSSGNGLSFSTTSVLSSISYDNTNGWLVSNNSSWLRYNTTSNQTRFRFFKSTTYTGTSYKTVQFFKKSGGVEYHDFLTSCCEGKDITLVDNGEKTGGKFSADVTSACAGDEVTLSANANTGYSFGSWSVNNGDITVTNNQFTMPDPAIDITVDATFTANTHDVLLQKNDGSGDYATQVFTFDVPQKIQKNTFERTGYKFNGWSTTGEGSVEYADEAEYTLTVDKNVQLYAVWTADDAVAVSVQGTEHLSDITAPTSISAKAKNLSFTYSVATGYKVVGVTVTIDGTPVTEGVSFTQTNFSLLSDADFAGAIVITFDVQEILNTITLDPGSGTCAQTEVTQEHYGSAVTLPTPTIAADGWTFAGWAAAKVETETESAPTLYTGEYTPTEDLTLYAVYKRGEEVESTTEKYVCDFEGTSAPTGWSFTNFSCTNSNVITPHTGSKWGSIASKSNSYVTFNTELTGKYKITAYVARTSGNNDNSTFSIKSSANNWGKVLGSSINVGNSSLQTDTWYELSWTGDLSNEKVEIFYTSSTTAVRALDDITIVKITEKNYYHSTPSIVTDLKVTKAPAANIKYKEGETFNPAGIELTATYDNDNSKIETVTSEMFTCDFSGAVPYGETTVTFTYKGKTCTQTITAMRLTEIKIENAPSKVEYVEGENFDNANLKVRAYYAYETVTTSELVSKDKLTYNPSLTTPLATTDTKVTISYKWADVTKSVDQAITVLEKVATPTFSPDGGKLAVETPITISCATPNATIYYTTDGTDPTTESEVYTEPVPMISGTLKAIATAENMGQSEVGKAVFIETIDPTNGDWMLVTDVNDLAEGDYLIIASNAKGWVAGKTEGTNLAHITTTFSDDKSILTYTADAMMFRLGGETGAWTLTNVDKEHLMGATDAKKLSWDNGTTTWSISIDNDNNATIQNGNSNYGRMLVNTNTQQQYFTTYTSATSSSMLLPQLYKYYKKVPKLIYDANGGTNAPVPTRSKNGVATVTDKTPTWGGYEFVKWTADKEGKGKEYTAGEEVAITADLTIYAQWQEKQLEGTPVAFVVQYGEKYYAMGKDLSAVEVEGIYNGNVVVVSEEIDQKSITWYRNDVEGGVTFQNCEEKYLQGNSSTNLNVVEDKDGATAWNWDNDNQYYYTTISSTKRSFFTQNAEDFKNYAVSNIGTGSYSSAATCCEGIRVGEVFTRNMSNGFMGTHCYPFDIAAGDYKGAQFYEIAYRIGDTRIYFDQVNHVEAGVPYLVVPEDEENGSVLEAIVTPKNVDASSKNGFYGSYEQEDLEANSGLYIVYNNEFRLAGNYVAVGANRAYIKLAEVETNDPQQGAANAPRRISLRNSNAQSPTGIDNVVAEFGDSKEAKKVIVNGNFYIINQGKVYGAQGQLVK